MSTTHTPETAAEYRAAYHDGREARSRGFGLGSNPHGDTRPDLAPHWQDGWRDEDDDFAAMAQSGPTPASNRYGHQYDGQRDADGYGLCSACGCRENTDASIRPCAATLTPGNTR